MTLITRITLNPAAREIRHVTASPQALHAVVAAITDGSTRPLWRLDNDRLYIVSDTFDRDRADARLAHPAIASSEYAGLDLIRDHGRYRFVIDANPVKTHDGRRTPIRQPGQQLEWLRNRLTQAGADADNISILTNQVSVFKHRNNDITLQKTRFAGTLTITDANRLRKTMLDGIGKSKAYGCGLLLLAA